MEEIITKYYKADVEWQESYRASKWRYAYRVIKYKKVLVKVRKNIAIIYIKVATGKYSKITKHTNGKYFIMKGKELKENTFKRNLNKFKKKINSEKYLQDFVANCKKMAIEQGLKINIPNELNNKIYNR